MKKNFRSTPDFVIDRINEIDSDNVIVATILAVDKNEIEDLKYKNLNLQLNNNQISFNTQYIPERTIGSFSRRNIDGYKIVYKDQEKVRRSFYLGERPNYGDWSKGSFSLFSTRMVYPSDHIPPKELSIITELLEETERTFKIKVSVDIVLNRKDYKFDQELFFTINLLQENIHSVNVFSSETTREEYLRTLSLTWDIFPPGERNRDLERIIRNSRNLSHNDIAFLENRYNYLVDLNPVEIIYGVSGMRKYFGAKFSERLVVFENLSYGNAIYVLFENWLELSQMSRTDIQARPTDDYIRIKHTSSWQQKLERVISARR